jgi:F-type H+-transporting ATPase subunit delta
MPRTAKEAKREAKRLFRWCLVDGRVDDRRARRVVQLVLHAQKRGYLSLLQHFQRLLKLDHDRHAAEIESAAPLPRDLETRVRTGLEHAYGPGLSTSFAQNPSLIGGMRIKVGNDVYDGSVQARLIALQESFGIADVNGRNT